jgi:hypothetical protein
MANPIRVQPKTPAQAAPAVLLIGDMLWKVFEYLEHLDLMLSVREGKFAVMFQTFSDYGGWIAALASAVWFYFARRNDKAGKRTSSIGLIVSVGCICFLWGVLVTAQATGSVPTIIQQWSATPTGCVGLIDAAKLKQFSTKYNVALFCGIGDAAVDKITDNTVAISAPFTIVPGAIVIEAKGKGFADKLQPPQLQPQTSPPPQPPSPPLLPPQAQLVQVQQTVWFEAVIIPKNVDMSAIHNLADVKRYGGKIMREGLFE